jgi:hypothetical protein
VALLLHGREVADPTQMDMPTGQETADLVI